MSVVGYCTDNYQRTLSELDDLDRDIAARRAILDHEYRRSLRAGVPRHQAGADWIDRMRALVAHRDQVIGQISARYRERDPFTYTPRPGQLCQSRTS